MIRVLRQSLYFFLFFAQVATAQHQSFLSYSLQDGLPQSQVYAITEDQDGYLWVGTQGGGLARFDGNNFEPLQVDLPDNNINALVSIDDKVWVGTNAGLSLVAKDTTYSLSWPPGSRSTKVTALAVDSRGVMWVGTEKGLYKVDIRKKAFSLQKVSRLQQANVRSFFFEEKEQWVATNTGAWQLNGTKRFSNKNGLESNDVHALFRDVLGRFWVATFNGRISLFDTETDEFVGALRMPNRQHPQFIAQVGEQVWIGTISNGMATYDIDTRQWSRIDERFGLAAKNIKTVFWDSWKNLWIGTSGDGLLKGVGQEFVHFGLQSGLKGDNIYAVFCDAQQRIWMAESGYGMSMLDENGLHHFGNNEGFANVKCKAIAQDKKGRLWFGTDGRGVAYWDVLGFHFLSEKDGMPSNWVNSLVIDSMGNVWASTYGNGITKIVDRDSLSFQIFPYGKPEGLPELRMKVLKIDGDGALWFATRNGYLGYYRKDFEPAIFDQANGLPNADIRSIEFADNEVWVGTAGKGVYHANWKKQPVQFVKLDDSKSSTPVQMSSNIYLLRFVKNKQLWIGTERGVNRVDLNYKSQVIDFKHFGNEEGFLGIETCQNAIAQDDQDNLWIGTMNGLMKYSALKEKKVVLSPKIHFEDIQLFYKSLEKTSFRNWCAPNGGILNGLVLPHDKNHLGFRLAGLNLARPNQVKYRWQLAGSETQWSPLSTTNNINYANLEPGTYVFKAQACLTPDKCSAVITAPFTIQKPYWQTWWFRLGVGGSLLLFAFLFYRIRIRTIRKQEQAKRKELELKNHLLTVEQKALQLQMNPHFIFNALNSINGLVALKDFAQARKQINRFAILMRQILSNSRKETISLEEEKKTLDNYLAMEQFCRPDVFEYSIVVENGIDEEELEVPPMIIQPFVENAIIHGVGHLDKKGQVDVYFAQKGMILVCEIKDNGIGRKKAAELRKKRNPSHQSTAMVVTKERLDALFAERQGKSIEITDIVAQDGTVAGTKVVLQIPIS